MQRRETRRMYRMHRCVLLALIGACCAPAVATAGTVGKDAASGTINFAALPGEPNHVELDAVPDSRLIRVTDTGASLTVLTGCFLDAGAVFCGDPSDDLPVSVDMKLGDRDDYANAFRPPFEIATLFGEGGDDELWASGNESWAYGGPGDDDIHTSNNFAGQSFGGTGDDRMTGHSGSDYFFGEGGADTLISGGQSVIFDGGPGADHLVGRDAETGLLLTGGTGDDVLELTGIGSPTPFGLGGYTLDGGDGDDVVNGGTDEQTFQGGAGDDRLHAWDGGADSVTCGPGFDTAYADAADTVADDCERVRLPAAAALNAVAGELARREISNARADFWRDRALESLDEATADRCYVEARLRVNATGERCFDDLHGAVRRLTVIAELAPLVTDIVRDLVAIEADIALARYDDADGALAGSRELSSAAHQLHTGRERNGLAASFAYRRAWVGLRDAPGRIPSVRCDDC
jgi:RTX calcium-binding nonapeptide repeat (4 copies)